VGNKESQSRLAAGSAAKAAHPSANPGTDEKEGKAMPALFEQGFFVREPAWHGLGVVLDDYPDRETAMRLAGHDWDVIVLDGLRVPVPNATLEAAGQEINPDNGGVLRKIEGWTAHVRSDTLELLHVARDSFERIPNAVAYDVAELLFEQGFQYETGILLDGGRTCAITLKLDEPILIQGDDSVTVPFGCLSWAHDGSAALKVRSGSIRQVCANTVTASEAEGKRLGSDFTFRHTKNWRDRVEDAKAAIRGVREGLSVYRDVMEELSEITVSPAQRDLFVSEIIGDRPGITAVATDRVKNNLEAERAKINSLFFGPTVPEAHRLTGYGLFQAGGEYFDHLRNYRTKDSYVRRTLLSDNPAKANLARTIRELVAV
jgi:phage/plasmid-like protein (TIGR03299 family)